MDPTEGVGVGVGQSSMWGTINWCDAPFQWHNNVEHHPQLTILDKKDSKSLQISLINLILNFIAKVGVRQGNSDS